MMAKVFSWEQSFSHNSTIMSCLQFQTLKSFFFYEVMVVIDGNVIVYFKSEIGKIKVCDLNLKSLYPGLAFRMCFSSDSARLYILPHWLFSLGVWTLFEKKILLWVRNCHLGLMLRCLVFKGRRSLTWGLVFLFRCCDSLEMWLSISGPHYMWKYGWTPCCLGQLRVSGWTLLSRLAEGIRGCGTDDRRGLTTLNYTLCLCKPSQLEPLGHVWSCISWSSSWPAIMSRAFLLCHSSDMKYHSPGQRCPAEGFNHWEVIDS